MKKFKLAGAILGVLIHFYLGAQNPVIHSVRNSATLGGQAYCTYDPVSDTVIDHTLLPGYLANVHVGTTTDTVHGIYYICDGTRMFGVDIQTYALTLSMVMPLSGMQQFTCIQYNPCDSLIYGVIADAITDECSAVYSFNPSDSSVAPLATLSQEIYHDGGQGAIDPASNVYLFELGGANQSYVGGYDIGLGALSFLTPISVMNPDITFRGISYDCANARVIGLQLHATTQEIHLASVHVLTGALTTISTGPIGTNYFDTGGGCLDHTNGIYHYMAAVNIMNRVDIISGSLLSSDTIATNVLVALETMTACPCPVTTDIPETSAHPVSVYPNPATDYVRMELDPATADRQAEVILYDVAGREVSRTAFTGHTVIVDISSLAPAMYTYAITSEESLLHRGTVLRQAN